MPTPLAGHTNSYHTYSFEEALAGIAEAGYRGVELSAVPGWTEHVDLDAPADDVRAEARPLRPRGGLALGPLRPDDEGRARPRDQGACAGRPSYGLPIVNTAIGGHWSEDEDESAFMGNIERARRRGQGRGRRRRARDPRRHHGLGRDDAARCMERDRARGDQGQLRHGQLRVLRRRRRRRRHPGDRARTWPTVT